MSQIVTGHWEPDGSDVYIPCGFVPDFLFAANFGASTELLYYWWGGEMEDAETTAGLADDGAGVLSKMTEGEGFNGYDSGIQAPYGVSGDAVAILDWAASDAYAARTAGVHGSYVNATSTGVDDNGLIVDRSAIFECVTAGTSDSSEPVWPSAIGATGPSDNGVVWEKVTNVATFLGGYKGFLACNDIQVDGEEFYYLAILADEVIDHGDVVNWAGGVKGM